MPEKKGIRNQAIGLIAININRIKVESSEWARPAHLREERSAEIDRALKNMVGVLGGSVLGFLFLHVAGRELLEGDRFVAGVAMTAGLALFCFAVACARRLPGGR